MFLVINVICASLFVCVYTEIAIIGKGIEVIEEDDIAMVFYITVKNICKDDLELSVNMLQCCEILGPDEENCNSVMLIGGDMGILPSRYVKNVTLIYPNLYLFNRRGVCSVEVTYRNQLKKREITTEIHYDTTKSCPKVSNQRSCETVDLDFKQNCNPVDCLIKYSGTNSYFNSDCKLCQKVAVCNSKKDDCFPDVAYSPYTNECVNLDTPISKNDLKNIDGGLPDPNQTTMVNAICHYGKVTENGKCVCHDGWASSTNDEDVYQPGVAQHHFCNIEIGDWNCLNKGRIRITAILIALFAVTIISKVLLVMCVMTWCYKHLRKSEKSCAMDLDPGNQSIILCDDQNSFTKCVCGKDEENNTIKQDNKLPKLQSQTVNVSYFSCSPSCGPSSTKTSGASTKYSNKTDPSVNLSYSTTSARISFPDTTSDPSEKSSYTLLNNDGVSNDVSYGVYCDINEVDENYVYEEDSDEEGSTDGDKSEEFDE